MGAAGGPGLGGGGAVPTGGGSGAAAGTTGANGGAGTPAVGGGGATETCTTGTEQCPGSTDCVNLSSDAANCGKCGAACKTQCYASACCDAPSKICGTSPHCVNVLTNAFHCGDCDKPCAAGQGCINGVCTSSVQPDASGGENACGAMGRVDVPGGYIVASNVGGATSASQTLCVVGDTTTAGFTVSVSTVSGSGSVPAAFPSIYMGTHYGQFASEGNPFPMQVSALKSVASTWEFTPGAGKWDVTYDIWLFPDGKATSPKGGMEIMIWVNYTDGVLPVGSNIGSFSSGGVTYDVWKGTVSDSTGSWSLVTFKAGTKSSSFNGDLNKFIAEAVSKYSASASWYLVGVEAGFEIWNGGQGMKTTAFSCKPL